eukprot:TRINITY_DN30447_c0_g1_i1.p2 TRINITY_DN30447_c0_g1~~TRINITY_DN30447_c0_g1_i1.p2  ORF type:complete len:523 (+),score=199.08 TRINITY_DN30447_c0_g1_i1:69-1571(+)
MQSPPHPTQRADVIPNFIGRDYRGEPDFDYEDAERRIMPVAALTPFGGRSWFVKVRVLEKQPVRRFQKGENSGLVTSFVAMDAGGTAIRANLFSDGVEKFYSMLEIGSVFYMGRGQVRNANKKFSSLPHDYELSFDQHSSIQPVRVGDTAASKIGTSTTANFIPLSEIQHRQVGSTVDVRAVAVNVSGLTEVVQKSTGRSLRRRAVQIADNSSPPTSIEVVLWEDQARGCELKTGQVVVLRNLRINGYQGTLSLSAGMMTSTEVGGDEHSDLASWWLAGGKTTQFKNLSQRAGDGPVMGSHRTGLDSIEKDQLGRQEKPDFINIRGMVLHLKEEGMWYDACPTLVESGRQCNKKLDPIAPGGKVRCSKCNNDIEKSLPRYIASVKVGDHTSDVWATMFDDVANAVFGVSAQQMKDDETQVQKLRSRLELCPMNICLRVKEEVSPQGEARMKHIVHRAKILQTARDFDVDCRNLLRDIDRYAEVAKERKERDMDLDHPQEP